MANERRVREAFRSGTIANNPLAIGGTTLNFGSDPGFATVDATEHLAIILDPEGSAGAPEIVYVTAFTAAGTTATISRAQENTTAREHASGTVWRHGPTVRDYPRGAVFAMRTGGNVSVTGGANWAQITLDAGDDVNASGDLVLAAFAGDVIKVGINAIWSAAAAIDKAIDVACMVTAGANSWFGTSGGFSAATGRGPMAWFSGASTNDGCQGVWCKELVAGDIENGVVALRPAALVGTTRTLLAGTTYRFEMWAENLGPKDSDVS